MKKKSQVSLFLIIALVIIVGAGIFFYATSRSQQEQQDFRVVEEQVPLQFDPVKQYVTECLISTSTEALKTAGEQGGYVSFTNRSLNKESFTITNNPTESDAVPFTRNSGLKIPYWHYLKSQNKCAGNCVFASKRSDLRDTENSIEKQLERYIDLNLKSCIRNFETLKLQGYSIQEKGAPKSDVVITEDDVIVSLDYEISASEQDSKSDMKIFSARIPVGLAKIYELATRITEMEMKHHYLEKHALNLIVSFSGVDNEKLPPMSDMKFSYGSKTSWQKTETKNRISGLLVSYVPLFQIEGTYNYDRNYFDSELKQRLYDSTIIPIANSSYSGISSEFAYLDFWPVYFDLNCRGERCTPASANSFFSFLGIQDYNFAYDLSFPVLVELKDEYAFNGQGYNFKFFLEANVRDNKVMESSFANLEIQEFSVTSQLCDVRTSGNVKVNAIDSATKKPISDVQVLYSLTGESCFIGATGDDGTAEDSFPVGVGGYVNLVKEGYIGKALEFNPKFGKEDSLDAELTPVYTKKLVVKKKNVVKNTYGWNFIDSAEDLNSKEQSIITFTRINPENELEFSSVALYTGGEATVDIELAPGDYSLEATLVAKERIVIPANGDMPRIDLSEGLPAGSEQFNAGGAILNFTISPRDMEKSTITVYVLNFDLASVPEQERVIEDLEEIGKVEEYSSKYHLALNPVME